MDRIVSGLILIAAAAYLTYKTYRVLVKKELKCCCGENHQHIHGLLQNDYNRGNRTEIKETEEASCGDTDGVPMK